MEQLERTTESSEYLDAFLRLRTAKGWLAWLVLLAIILNLGLCLTVRSTSLLDKSPMLQSDLATLRGAAASVQVEPKSAEPKPIDFIAPAIQPTTQPASQPAAAEKIAAEVSEPEKAEGGVGDVFYQILHVLLPMARVGGLFCGTLLVLVLLLSLKVVLLGRLRGVGYLTSALLWSLVLLVLLIPWDAAFAGFPVPGVLFGARELIEGSAQVALGAQGVGWEDHLLYWMRFVGYPVLALILWLTIQVQYARSYRPMVAGLQTEQSS